MRKQRRPHRWRPNPRAFTDEELEAAVAEIRDELQALAGLPGTKTRHARRALKSDLRLLASEVVRRERRAGAIKHAAKRQAARRAEPLSHLERAEQRRALRISGLVSMWEEDLSISQMAEWADCSAASMGREIERLRRDGHPFGVREQSREVETAELG